MGLSGIKLKNYDTVAAMTQEAVNSQMYSFLRNQKQSIAIYATIDKEGNYTLVDKDSPDAYYWITADINIDINPATKNPYDIIQLKTDDVQMVKYYINLKNGVFQTYVGPIPTKFTQDADKAPWKLEYDVKLALGPTDFNKLDTGIRNKVNDATQDVGRDLFSIEQLYLDLNQAVFASDQQLEGIPTGASSTLGGIMQLYLKDLKKSGDVLFGAHVKFTGPDPKKCPTFMPSYVNFCVTPFSVTQPDPDLDTLNYLVMTDNSKPPTNTPKQFGYTFVDSNSVQGAIAIKSALIIPFMLKSLQPILQAVSPTLKVEAKENGANSFSIIENTSLTLPKWGAGSGGTVGTYSYTSADKADAGLSKNYTTSDASGTFTSEVTASIADSLKGIHFAGTIKLDYLSDWSYFPINGYNVTKEQRLPGATFSWSMDMQLEVDVSDTSQLNLVFKNFKMDEEPTIDDSSTWEKILEALSGVVKENVENLQTQRSSSIKAALLKVEPAVTLALQRSQSVSRPEIPCIPPLCHYCANSSHLSFQSLSSLVLKPSSSRVPSFRSPVILSQTSHIALMNLKR
jgi:hypothetical protein